jgi:hypothetical protein
MRKSRLITYIITIIGGAFLMINLKKSYFDAIWDYFFAIQIFMLNFSELLNYLKEEKRKKLAVTENSKDS